jgi:hypothetical protein
MLGILSVHLHHLYKECRLLVAMTPAFDGDHAGDERVHDGPGLERRVLVHDALERHAPLDDLVERGPLEAGELLLLAKLLARLEVHHFLERLRGVKVKDGETEALARKLARDRARHALGEPVLELRSVGQVRDVEEKGGLDARLLEGLAHRRFPQRLVGVDPALRELPLPGKPQPLANKKVARIVEHQRSSAGAHLGRSSYKKSNNNNKEKKT